LELIQVYHAINDNQRVIQASLGN